MPISTFPIRLSRPVLAAAALAVSLAGCATSTANLSSAPAGAYRDTIDLAGSLSVSYQKQDGQHDHLTGRYTWTQRPGRIDVSLNSPVSTVAEISVTPDSATLTQANRPPQSARDIDALTQQALGWPLPVAGLRDWLQGYATDAQGKRFAASPANNNVFTRDGWRLRFVDWQAGANGAPMPKTINAERSATATSGELSLRISISPES
jgi:outer membrane lipoprotein LolB